MTSNWTKSWSTSSPRSLMIISRQREKYPWETNPTILAMHLSPMFWNVTRISRQKSRRRRRRGKRSRNQSAQRASCPKFPQETNLNLKKCINNSRINPNASWTSSSTRVNSSTRRNRPNLSPLRRRRGGCSFAQKSTQYLKSNGMRLRRKVPSLRWNLLP